MDNVVGDVDQPGAEETSPANSQHDMDMVRGQIMVTAVDILDLDSPYFSDFQHSMNGQTLIKIQYGIYSVILVLYVT